MRRTERPARRCGGDPLNGEWCPRLAEGIVLRHDRVRRSDVLLLPERVVTLNESAAAVLRLCDGIRSVEQITAELLALYQEPTIPASVDRFLERMRGEGWVQ